MPAFFKRNNMTDKEYSELIIKMKSYGNKTLKSRKLAIESLNKAGILDLEGNLIWPYCDCEKKCKRCKKEFGK
jgi:hypothetical protein